MKLAFYKGKWDWTDTIIKRWTWWIYSHVELIFSNWVSFSASWRDWWVRFKNINYIDNNWDVINLNISKKKEQLIFHNAQSKTWMKYDWVWILLSQVLPFNIQDNNKWFCSEIVWYLIWIKYSAILSPQWLYNKLTNK